MHLDKYTLSKPQDYTKYGDLRTYLKNLLFGKVKIILLKYRD